MSYGDLNEQQREALKPFLSGRLVHDLGSGNQILSRELIRLGAEKVIAIDKDPYRDAPGHGIEPVTTYFENYQAAIHTAFVSWPRNTYDAGLIALIERAECVVYLGKNTDGLACGFPKFWEHLRQREALAHVPDPRNTLIVYGHRGTKRATLPEELAALQQDRLWGYGELHAAP